MLGVFRKMRERRRGRAREEEEGRRHDAFFEAERRVAISFFLRPRPSSPSLHRNESTCPGGAVPANLFPPAKLTLSSIDPVERVPPASVTDSRSLSSSLSILLDPTRSDLVAPLSVSLRLLRPKGTRLQQLRLSSARVVATA